MPCSCFVQLFAHAIEQPVDVKRLLYVIVRAGIERFDHCLARVLARHDDDRHVRLCPDVAAELKPVHRGHAQVRYDEPGPPLAESCERAPSLVSHTHLIPLGQEEVAHCVPHAWIVVDHEDPRFVAHSGHKAPQ